MFPTKEILHNSISYKSCKHVSTICRPLKEHLGIDYFSIHYETVNWKEKRIENFFLNTSYEAYDIFYDYHKKKPDYQIDINTNLENYQKSHGKYLLDSPKAIEVAHEVYGLHNMLRKLEKINDNEWIRFAFATKSHDTKYLSFYLNNLDLLNKFILYFKDTAESLIKRASTNKIFFDAITTNPGSDAKINVIGETPLNKDCFEFLKSIEMSHHRLIGKNGRIIKIPRAEMMCLKLLAHGRSFKEIANALSISPRTVETNLNNSKQRLGCFSRKELLDLLELNGVE